MLWTDQVRCYADESCALFHSLEGYTVAVNKKFTFRIRTTIVVRTENLRSRSTKFLRSTIADSAIIAVPSKWLNSPTFISGYK